MLKASESACSFSFRESCGLPELREVQQRVVTIAELKKSGVHGPMIAVRMERPVVDTRSRHPPSREISIQYREAQ